MIKLLIKIALIAVPLLFLMSDQVWGAPGIPDSVSVDKAQSFIDVLETGDVLFLAKFNVTYENCNTSTATGCPEEFLSDTFVGSLLDATGTASNCTTNDTALRSVNPVITTAPGLNGYGDGVFSVYLSASAVGTTLVDGQASRNCHALEIEGNPAFFADPSQARSELGVSSSTFTLAPTIRARAQELEQNWGITLLQVGGGFLDDDGEDYFERAIPNLRQMSGASALFSGSIVSPEKFEETFDTSHDSELRNYGSGTIFDTWNTAFGNLETAFGVPSMWAKASVALAAMAFVAFMVLRVSQDGRIAALSAPITLSVFTLTGFLPLAFMAIMVIFSAIALAYLVFLKGA